MKFLTTTFDRLRRSRTSDGTSHQIAAVRFEGEPIVTSSESDAGASAPTLEVTGAPQRMIVSLCPMTACEVSQARDLGTQLIRLIDRERPQSLVLDLGQLMQLSSECLNQLISVNCHARSHGIQLVLANLCEPLRDVFRITRLDRLFELIDEE